MEGRHWVGPKGPNRSLLPSSLWCIAKFFRGSIKILESPDLGFYVVTETGGRSRERCGTSGPPGSVRLVTKRVSGGGSETGPAKEVELVCKDGDDPVLDQREVQTRRFSEGRCDDS